MAADLYPRSDTNPSITFTFESADRYTIILEKFFGTGRKQSAALTV